MALKRFLGTFCVLLLGTATAETPITIVGTYRQVTTNPLTQTDPAISGNRVVYTDNRNGNDDFYLFDLSTNVETRLTTATTAQRLGDVSGTRIVYTDLTPPLPKIFLYEVTTGATTVLTSGPDQNTRTDGQTAVFERNVGGNVDVYGVNLSMGTEFPVGTTSDVELNPTISGARIVYERHHSNGLSEIVLNDLSTMIETVLSQGLAVARRPHIAGNLVVWDVLSGTDDQDIAIYDLSTGMTKVITRPGNQRFAHISGRFVSFDDDSSGTPDVGLYHLDSETVFLIGAPSSAEFLNSIDGNRVVYTSNISGNLDIWAFEFAVQPAVDVAPTSVQFGSVNIGTSSTQLVTAANLQNNPLTVENISLDVPGGGFWLGSMTFPQVLPLGGSMDIAVNFAPSVAGPASNTLRITTAWGEVQVPLAGLGVNTAPPPQQQIAEILVFFDVSVQSGRLTGDGSGNSAAGRRDALRNMLKAAGDLIQQGRIGEACQQLSDASNRTDGNSRPPDFVTGLAASELAQKLQALRAALGCA